MRRVVVAVVLLLAGVAGVVVAGSPVTAATGDERDVAGELLAFANRERAARGLPALVVDAYAASTAQEWADGMRARGRLAHRQDLLTRYRDYPAAGENVGRTHRGTGALHRDWMGSGDHRRNLLQPGFDGAGVGVSCGPDGAMWVSFDFVATREESARAMSGAVPPSSPVAVADGGRGCGPSGTRAAAPPPAAAGAGRQGYWLVGGDGGVFSFGDARFAGSTGAIRLNQPVVGMAAPPGGVPGYWLVASDGGVFAFASARFAGSTGAIRLNQPVVGMASTPSGSGYWLVARDGGIFAFGDAPFAGSTGAIRLNQPVVSMAPTASGKGYWLVARDGGVFNFGDARFAGSAAGRRPAPDVVAMVPTPSGGGYWLAASDGAVFAFGDAPFLGSAPGLGAPVVAIAAAPGGRGYWLVAANGTVAAFGSAADQGSARALTLTRPIVGAAAAQP